MTAVAKSFDELLQLPENEELNKWHIRADSMPRLSAGERSDQDVVPQCYHTAWVKVGMDESNRVTVVADSDDRFTRGLLLHEVLNYNGKTLSEALAVCDMQDSFFDWGVTGDVSAIHAFVSLRLRAVSARATTHRSGSDV